MECEQLNKVNNLNFCYSSIIPPVIPPPSFNNNLIVTKIDSGASGTYIRKQDENITINQSPISNGPRVILPDNSAIQPTTKGHLNLPGLSNKGTNAFIFPDLKSASLISVGQLCDDGCTVTFTAEDVTATKNKQVVLHGDRNLEDKLWDIKFDQFGNHIRASTHQHNESDLHCLNVIIPKDLSISKLIQFYQGCLFSPAKSTLLKAVNNNNFITWPGLTPTNVQKYYKDTVYTAKGHLNQEKQNIQSTKLKMNPIPTFAEQKIADEDSFPTVEVGQKTQNYICSIQAFQYKDTGYSDLTGRFPFQSTRGNEYILVMYDYDSNAILAKPVKNRQAAVLKEAFMELFGRLKQTGTAPSFYILDNECSNDLKSALSKNNIKFQLAPPHQHRRNAAERAIQTFKNHFIAGLASTHPKFPIQEWDRLVQQAEITLNLLRNTRINPKLSAYEYLNGSYNFPSTPMLPPGTKIVVHEKPDQRASWANHGVDAWYTAPALNHYRCVTAFIPKTHKERVADTIKIIPHEIPLPEYSQQHQLKQCVKTILSILKNPSKQQLPFLQPNNELLPAIQQTAEILNTVVPDTIKVKPPLSNKEPKHQLPKSTSPSKVVPPPRVHAPQLPRVQEPQLPRVRQPPPQQFQSTQQPYQAQLPQLYPHTDFRQTALQRIIHQQLFHPPLYMNHIYNKKTGRRETIETLMTGENSNTWTKAVSNEFGRLTKGNKYGVKFTDTMEFISANDVPAGKKVTYGSFTCDHRPLKEEEYRARLVVGGDKLTYHADASSPAASILETKILVNSILSDYDEGARFMSVDLKDFFLQSFMESPEFMRLPFKWFPQDIIEKYNLSKLVTKDGFIYIKIKRGMYGLRQAAILAYKQLVKNLEPYGYYPIPHTIGMWAHKTRRTKFCLCVDDFGIKYYNKEDAYHLLDALRDNYKISIDWEGKHYCGLTFKWDYTDKYVDVTMPGYIAKTLDRYQHKRPRNPVYSPHKYNPPEYGKRLQMAADPDISEKLDIKNTRIIQGIVGSLLYYSRCIDPTMLTALNEIGAEQASPTANTKKKTSQLLDYAATYEDTTLRFYASDMILHMESDAAYLVQPGARSRIAGYFYLSDKPPPNTSVSPTPTPNGPIHVVCKTLRHVVASAAEAETAALFFNAQEAIPIRYLLEQLGHKQPKTPIKTDNTTALSFIHKNIRQKRSKSWDMRYFWLRDKNSQNMFSYYWKPGTENMADYFTKHHSVKHHLNTRHKFVLSPETSTLCVLRLLNSKRRRGCVGTTKVPTIPPLAYRQNHDTDLAKCQSSIVHS